MLLNEATPSFTKQQEVTWNLEKPSNDWKTYIYFIRHLRVNIEIKYYIEAAPSKNFLNKKTHCP